MARLRWAGNPSQISMAFWPPRSLFGPLTPFCVRGGHTRACGLPFVGFARIKRLGWAVLYAHSESDALAPAVASANPKPLRCHVPLARLSRDRSVGRAPNVAADSALG